jgi:hypothetical protein
VEVEGSPPPLQYELTLGTPTIASHNGMVATTMRIVNTIAATSAALQGW